MKYLQTFDSYNGYTAFQNSEEYVEPHVALVYNSGNKIIKFKNRSNTIKFVFAGDEYETTRGITWYEWWRNGNDVNGRIGSSYYYPAEELPTAHLMSYAGIAYKYEDTGEIVYMNEKIIDNGVYIYDKAATEY
jgi:hypothetical protein